MNFKHLLQLIVFVAVVTSFPAHAEESSQTSVSVADQTSLKTTFSDSAQIEVTTAATGEESEATHTEETNTEFDIPTIETGTPNAAAPSFTAKTAIAIFILVVSIIIAFA